VQRVAAQYVAEQYVLQRKSNDSPAVIVNSQTSSSCAGHLQCIAAQYIAAQNVFQRTSNDSRAVIIISHTTHSRTGRRSQRKRHGRRRSSCISGCCS